MIIMYTFNNMTNDFTFKTSENKIESMKIKCLNKCIKNARPIWGKILNITERHKSNLK